MALNIKRVEHSVVEQPARASGIPADDANTLRQLVAEMYNEPDTEAVELTLDDGIKPFSYLSVIVNAFRALNQPGKNGKRKYDSIGSLYLTYQNAAPARGEKESVSKSGVKRTLPARPARPASVKFFVKPLTIAERGAANESGRLKYYHGVDYDGFHTKRDDDDASNSNNGHASPESSTEAD